MSLPPDEIQQAVPTSGNCVDPNSTSVQRLKELMEAVETIKAERDTIESELKSATFNMKDEFLAALQKDGAIDEAALSLARIGQVINPLQAQVKDSIERQQTLVADIQQAHAQFTAESGNCGSSRDQLFQELATGYNSFVELTGNLKEGTKFYNDLTQLLVVFQNKISDFCFARKTEKEELLKDLTTESSRQAPGPTPALPSHYSSTSGSGNDDVPSVTSSTPSMPAAPPGNVPYPQQMHGMPVPYGATANVPYPTYIPPPMPQGFNPYATLPYPSAGCKYFYNSCVFGKLFKITFFSSKAYQFPGFPQGPPPGHYGTYPGSFAHQQGGYPNQKPPGW